MVKKYFKKILCGLGIASFLFSPISNVYANSQDMSKETRALGTYTGTVKKYDDIQSTLAPKGADNTAHNMCDSKTSGRLISWVEDSKNNNVSYKSGVYSSNGTKSMSYNGKPPRGNVKLNVSTAVDQIKNVGTTGRFHS